jgi:Tfp pilus assembly protein PilN
MLLTTIKNNAQSIIDSNQTKANEFGTVQEDAAALQTSLASAKALFDQEINYPAILTTLGSLVPTGVVVDKLTLNAQTLALPFDIQVYATTTDAAAALQTALEGSPLFSGVTMKSLSSANGLDDYPVNAVITATINKEVVR